MYSVNNPELKSKIMPQFNIYKDFELRDILEKESSNLNKQQDQNLNIENDININEQMDIMIKSLPIINDNIRSNILLDIEIYKKLNNFDRNYIHIIINENSTKSKKSKDF